MRGACWKCMLCVPRTRFTSQQLSLAFEEHTAGVEFVTFDERLADAAVKEGCLSGDENCPLAFAAAQSIFDCH